MAGGPRVEVEAADLQAGGVPDERAALLAQGLNACVQTGIVQAFQAPVLPDRMARAGRLRAAVRDAQGNLVANARVEVTGAIIAFATGGSGCPTQSDAEELEDNRIVCRTNENGSVTFVLLGNRSIAPVSVRLTVESADGALSGQLETAFIAPLTIDQTITVTSP